MHIKHFHINGKLSSKNETVFDCWVVDFFSASSIKSEQKIIIFAFKVALWCKRSKDIVLCRLPKTWQIFPVNFWIIVFHQNSSRYSWAKFISFEANEVCLYKFLFRILSARFLAFPSFQFYVLLQIFLFQKIINYLSIWWASFVKIFSPYLFLKLRTPSIKYNFLFDVSKNT